MISPMKLEKIRRLLAKGRLSRTRIAHLTRVSRATIRRIALEKRRQMSPLSPVDNETNEADTLKRCPGCGGIVRFPCRLCRVRGRIERRQAERCEERRAAARAALVAVLKAQRSRVSAGSAIAALASPKTADPPTGTRRR